MPHMQPVIIWDLDGTLANCDHRLHWILQKTPAQWDEFHKRTLEDEPYLGAKLIYNALLAQDVTLFIFTARPEINRELTELWLFKHDFHHDGVYMRPNTLHAKGPEVKRAMIKAVRLKGYVPVLAFEDQPDVVTMYRQEGIACWAADDTRWRNGGYKEIPNK